jgi:hypothetical protein
MTTVLDHDEHVRTQIPARVPWALIAGGVFFFVGGAMHPEEDPPDVTLKEHLRVMYEDGNWYASHTLQLIGVVLVAVALVALARSGALVSSRHAQRVGVVAAVGAVGWAFGSFLHLIAATEADRIAADRSTPLTDALIVVETITVPVFCLGVVLLAVVGLRTGLVGNRTAAACALVGGVAYAVAGATFAFTDALDPLFPLASFIGVWAVVTGVSMLRRRTASAPRQGRDEGGLLGEAVTS